MRGMLAPDAITLEKLRSDHHRPTYHFLPPMNWMNDPNGLVQWNGVYHLFYQHNPVEAQWGPMHWGHATSTDLLHWEHHPIAMEPTPGGPDELGCWSGVTVIHDGAPVVVYSGNSAVGQRCCLATTPDDLQTLVKHPDNPVIPDLPTDPPIADYRDHCLWRDGEVWNQLVGARVQDNGGAVLLYRSTDLVHWEYAGPILVGGEHACDPLPPGAMWECPDLIPLGDGQYLLVLSILTDGSNHTGCFIGRFDGSRFTPERYQRMDYGDWEYYAPQSFVNEAGERIHFGWIQEARSIPWQLEAQWSGALSLPRRVELLPGGQIGIQPHPVVERLRREHHSLEAIELRDGDSLDCGIYDSAVELRAVFSPGAGEVGLSLLRSPDGEEHTDILYDRASGWLRLDRTHASLDERAYRHARGGELSLSPGEDLDLRIFIDHSVIEVFANGRAALTARAYPTRADSTSVHTIARGGTAILKRLDAWRMA